MDLDPLSVVTPARVKVILLPVGFIRQSRFTSFVQRLQGVNVVRLGDVSPDNRPHRTMFSPLAFPEGLVLYDLSTSLPPMSHLSLAPFEIYREPLVVVGLADGIDPALGSAQHEQGQGRSADCKSGEDTTSMTNVGGLRTLVRALEDLIDQYPRALVHQILVFDHEQTAMPERIYPVPTLARSKTTTIKTVMCDLTSRLLAEMALYARSLLSIDSLDSPKMTDLSHVGNSRSSMAVGDGANPDHRMSMLTKLHSHSHAASGVSTPDSRPTSPANGARTPPASLNEITSLTTVQSPRKASGHDRASSRGRASGFGANSLGERERMKGKGRIGTVIGALYLLAGRWPDAVKELVQAAGIARNGSDYLWHAKAMDYVLVCLLLYAWAGMDFRIPENLFPGTEKPGSSSSKSSKHASSNSVPDSSGSKSIDPVARAASLRTLTNLLPDLANNILNLYTRAWTFTDDKLPPLAYSQSALRLAKLLSTIHLHHGELDDALLRHLVLNIDLPVQEGLPSERIPFMKKGELIELLFRGYPGPPSETSLATADRTIILAGIASVLSDIGFYRKKALVLKELMTGLLPALVQARKDGAAEMGVHPAASLASLHASVGANPMEASNGTSRDSEQGMQNFLSLVCRSYGIVSFESLKTQHTQRSQAQSEKEPHPSIYTHFGETTASRALQHASARASGSNDLKIQILRSCINVCEALPDLGGALQYSAELLRLGGSGIAPGPDSNDGSTDLGIEEQLRLVNNISRTLNAARQLGFEYPEAEYWDEFLVRGIEPIDASSARSLQPHAKSELELIEANDAKKEKNPFIYNPFIKTKASAARKAILVAQEECLFRITLQNLYDFDVVVEWVKVLADGVPFECEAQSTLIGPYRTQTVILSGTPLSSGTLAVRGCLAKIKGCRERAFPTFIEPWSLKADVKGRHVGLAEKTGLTSTASDSSKNKTPGAPKGPSPSVLPLEVLGAQPNLSLKSISAPQAAIMLLEGESARFTVSLQNKSRVAPIDLLLVSFDDPTTSQRRSVLSDKALSATQLYEIELDLAHRQSLRWHRKEEDRDLRIDAGGETTLEIEVLGKSGLSYGTIQVDYSHLSIPKSAIQETFYTRQLMVPLTVTVNPSINIVDNDILALPSEFTIRKQPEQDPTTAESDNPSPKPPPTAHSPDIETSINPPNPPNKKPHCLLLDLRNSWSNTLTVTLEISNPSTPPSSPHATPHTHSLQPNTTHRMPIPIPRLHIPNPHAPIPSLNPANKRQFVVSATQNTPDAERAMREAFWYREALLARLKATWRDESTGRTGSIDLRALKLTPPMLSALKLPELDIRMSVISAEPEPEPEPEPETESATSPPPTIQKTSPTTFTAPLSTFLTLLTHLHNRSPHPITPLLRLQPTLANQPTNITIDLSKKLLVNGILQRALPKLEPGESRTVETGFLLLNRGEYEWRASVEEVVAVGKVRKEGRERAATGDLDLVGGMGRRTWVAEEVCIVEGS